MTNEELLRNVELVLNDAVQEAEFTQRPKDVAYCQMVGQKLEDLRGHGMRVTTWLEGGRIVRELYMEKMPYEFG